MVGSDRFGCLISVVSAAIIYNQDFDFIDSGDLPGESGNRLGQCFSFVITRYLDNQFHRM